MLYDYVVNNYTSMSKEELKNIICEILWVENQHLGSEEDYEAFENAVKESLKENCDYDF